ncbi:MAG: flagellar hook-basal body complex protein FliE [bacterium]
MVEPISSISPFLSRTEGMKEIRTEVGGGQHPFEKVMDSAIGALNNISATETNANNIINQYVAGNADLSETMLLTSKAGSAVQLAVTVITSTVNTFKEITQMQI